MKNKQTFFYVVEPTLENNKCSLVTKKIAYQKSYKALSHLVGGYIECFDWIKELNDKNINIWIDEEGKFKKLLPSMLVFDNEYSLYNVVVGKLVFTKFNDDGESYGLTEQECKELETWLKNHIYVNNDIVDSRFVTYSVLAVEPKDLY